MNHIPEVTFYFHNQDNITSDKLFNEKRVVVFAIPGAFTPTCSTKELPGYEELYDEIKSHGIDEIYCISVNDSYVMDAWFDKLEIKNVKYLPDGNAFFAGQMNELVLKNNLGLGFRSWRYSMIVNNGIIEKLWEEEGKVDDAEDDPYDITKPEVSLYYLKLSNPIK